MKLGPREFIFFAAMLALLGCAYFFVFTKADARRDALRQDTAAKQKALTNLNKATAGIDDLGRKIKELEDAIRFFESKLPAEREVDKLLEEVTQRARANALQTRTIRTMRAEKAAHYNEQPIQLSLSGDFNGFYSFLLQLERLPRITRINQMKLNKINDRDGEMEADLTLSIFFEPDTRTAGAR
jgi:type IV pilus assembly protein PilO